MRTSIMVCALLGLMALTAVHASVYFHEEFKSMDHWTQSKHRDDYGKVEISAGNFYADAEKSKGLRLTQDARFYSISTALPTPVTNDKKDLVVSFSVKHEQDLKCGGGYIKLLPAMDAEKFHGETKYWLMFGPDRCGSTNKVHIIFHYGGKNHEWKESVRFPEDKLTHVYTLHVRPDNTYEFYLDGESKVKGALEEGWGMLPLKEIVDPADSTPPSDWVHDAEMDDPADQKPDDWVDEPPMIPDPSAKKPDDWDDAEDGEWEPTSIANPAYKGPWRPRRIPNPAYKGPWTPRMIPNPEYKPDDTLYRAPEPLAHVGIDVWMVEAGSIFKDIIIGDDVEEVLALVQNTYGGLKKAEADALSAMEEAKKAKKDDEEDAADADKEEEGEEADKEDL